MQTVVKRYHLFNLSNGPSHLKSDVTITGRLVELTSSRLVRSIRDDPAERINRLKLEGGHSGDASPKNSSEI